MLAVYKCIFVIIVTIPQFTSRVNAKNFWNIWQGCEADLAILKTRFFIQFLLEEACLYLPSTMGFPPRFLISQIMEQVEGHNMCALIKHQKH